jgi:sulfatase maturation enzyme AslB (radical SAM superfamily)
MLRDIKVLHLEPTDVCQAACALCARETDANFRKDQQHHLDMQKIQQVFNSDRIAGLDKMFMCGVYGDPAAGKHTLDIYRQFRKINNDIVLGMNTNGALQNTTWWRELGNIFDQPQDYVVFSIDGLEDTNHVYRKNVDWSKLMQNAASYISAGGSAHWDMLVYQHNEHQVEACQQLAREMGFKWFRAKVSKRGFTGTIKQPVKWFLPQVQSNIISCHALNEHSTYIDAQGRESPCCWLGGRQTNFVKNFYEIQNSWSSDNPESICVSTCGVSKGSSSVSNQWHKEIELNV